MSHTPIETLLFLYLIIINVIAIIIFSYDKYASVTSRKRIKVAVLHSIEILGGAFANLLLIYVLRHKSKKPNYYMWTWMIFTIWMFIVLLVFFL